MRAHLVEQCSQPLAVGQVQLDEAKARIGLQLRKPSLLERYVVVTVEVVQPDNWATAFEQAQRAVHTDEAGAAGDENRVHGAIGAGSHTYS